MQELAQRKHFCFPASSPGLESWLCQDFFSLLLSLWTVLRSNPSRLSNVFHRCSERWRPELSNDDAISKCDHKTVICGDLYQQHRVVKWHWALDRLVLTTTITIVKIQCWKVLTKNIIGGNIFLLINNYLKLFHLFYHKYKLLVALRLHFSKFNRTWVRNPNNAS